MNNFSRVESGVHIQWVFKHNRRVVNQPLHDLYRLMLQMCANDLTADGVNLRARVIFQMGKSRNQTSCYGLCDYFCQSLPTIYIYTYRRRVNTVLNTIAHEFGHVGHFATQPVSRQWPSVKMERYANLYEKLMRERFNERLAKERCTDIA